ncbi:hypothetical protein BC940DRAFT_295799 [Gongronella butleri]|nr:hypothetical protein BC940DRAFT_295799 [Gongronella butleri]
MTLSTPPTSPPTQSTSSASLKHELDALTLPRNSAAGWYQESNESLPSVHAFAAATATLDLVQGPRKAMSVMSYASYQYDSTLDNESVQSAPALDDQPVPLSKHDLAASIQNHEALLAAAKQYREHLAGLSKAAANFGLALETMAKQKTAMDTGQELQAVAGLQFLISNHHHLLADTCHKVIEVPLQEQLEDHRKIVKTSQANYEEALQSISSKIRRTEAANLQQAKKGQRDLRQYRRTLQDLTRQVDELDQVKSGYHRHMEHVEQQHHQALLFQAGWLVRAQVDVFELLAGKGLGDKTLEAMMQHHPDPFSAYATVHDRDSSDLFTVLPTNALIDPIPSPQMHLPTSPIATSPLSCPQSPIHAHQTRQSHHSQHHPPSSTLSQSQSPPSFRYPPPDPINMPLPPLPHRQNTSLAASPTSPPAPQPWSLADVAKNDFHPVHPPPSATALTNGT